MSDFFSTRKEVLAIRSKYPPGTRLVLTETLDDPQPIEKGEKGTVKDVDDAGHILMRWDCGRSLNLIVGEDHFEIIEDEGESRDAATETSEVDCFDFDKLEQIMIEKGAVIRAIPNEHVEVYETSHKDKFPEGEVRYSPKFKREMLHVTVKNTFGGKFIVSQETYQTQIISDWKRTDNGEIIYYDSLFDAIKSLK